MKERTKARAGTAVAVALAGDGLLHAYWATGRYWPAHDAPALAHAVLNTDRPFTPMTVGPLAGLLCLGALAAQARVHRLGRLGGLIPDAVLQGGILVIAAGAMARCVAGVRWALEGDAGTTFSMLNRTVYTPASLALAAVALAAARAAGASEPAPANPWLLESARDGR